MVSECETGGFRSWRWCFGASDPAAAKILSLGAVPNVAETWDHDESMTVSASQTRQFVQLGP